MFEGPEAPKSADSYEASFPEVQDLVNQEPKDSNHQYEVPEVKEVQVDTITHPVASEVEEDSRTIKAAQDYESKMNLEVNEPLGASSGEPIKANERHLYAVPDPKPETDKDDAAAA